MAIEIVLLPAPNLVNEYLPVESVVDVAMTAPLFAFFAVTITPDFPGSPPSRV